MSEVSWTTGCSLGKYRQLAKVRKVLSEMDRINCSGAMCG